jgi:hypothetical protein
MDTLSMDFAAAADEENSLAPAAIAWRAGLDERRSMLNGEQGRNYEMQCGGRRLPRR